MPDQLRTMTMDVHAEFEVDRGTQPLDRFDFNQLLANLDRLHEEARNAIDDPTVGLDKRLKSLLDEATTRISTFRGVGQEKHESDEKRLRELLSEKTQTFNDRVERELRRQLPPYVSVLANIQFEQGNSIVALGTVALLSWAGSIVLDATKEEAAKQLSELVKIAVRRSIDFVFGLVAQPLSTVSRMQMNVVARDPASSTLIAGLVGSSTQTASIASRTFSAASPTQFTRLMPATVVLLALILLLLLVLVFDRFFTIQVRTMAIPASPTILMTFPIPSMSASPRVP